MKNKTTNSQSNGAKPIHRIRNGAVSASIWPQETKNGMMFSVTFQRTYKDGDDWKYSSNFGRRDLLVVGLLAARAFEWIATKSQKKTSSEQPPSDDTPF